MLATIEKVKVNWTIVSQEMDMGLLNALASLWFTGRNLTSDEKERLQLIFVQYPLGQTNFNTWTKQTLRQLQENYAAKIA